MKYTEIIDKYLDGEMTPEEATAFEQQVKTDPDLAYEIKLHQLAIEGVQHSEDTDFQEFKSRMEAIENEIAEEEKKETPKPQMEVIRDEGEKDNEGNANRRIRRWAMRIAAVLIPLLLLYFLFPFTQKENNPLAATGTKLIELHVGGSKGVPVPQPSPLGEAIQLFQQKNYQAAIASFDQIIKENPEDRPTALFLKADALYRLDKKTEARKTLQRICPEGNDETLCETTQGILEKYNATMR